MTRLRKERSDASAHPSKDDNRTEVARDAVVGFAVPGEIDAYAHAATEPNQSALEAAAVSIVGQ
jgi:hypothetical protein